MGLVVVAVKRLVEDLPITFEELIVVPNYTTLSLLR